MIKFALCGDRAMKKTGLYGGSFDPIHNGHIKTALVFKEQMDLDKVVIMPAKRPPNKPDAKLADNRHRIAMCKLAFEDYKGFDISDIEIKRRGVSYTCDTLRSLSPEQFGRIYLLCGADMFLTLQNWKNPDIIFSLADIVTVPRDKNDLYVLEEHKKVLEKHGAKIHIIDTPKIDVSSTQIRKMLSENKSITGLVPKSVESYIYEKGLYGR